MYKGNGCLILGINIEPLYTQVWQAVWLPKGTRKHHVIKKHITMAVLAGINILLFYFISFISHWL